MVLKLLLAKVTLNKISISIFNKTSLAFWGFFYTKNITLVQLGTNPFAIFLFFF